MREREAFQELDYRAVFGSIAKWVVEIDDPARLPELVSRAFHVATSGRPGPVVIALPEDMLTEGGERRRRAALRAGRDPSGARPDGRAAEAPLGGPAPDRDPRRQPLVGAGRAALRALRRALRAAGRRPRSAARCCSRPTTPAYAGDLGIGPNPKLLARVKEADLVLLVGGRMSEMPSQSYTLFDIPTPRQPLVHVHPDAGRARPRLPPASRHQRLADRLLGGARGPAAAGTRSPGPRRPRKAHADFLAWSDPAVVHPPGALADERGDGASARDAAGRHHLLQRRRQLRDLGAPLLALSALRHAARADLRLDGLRRAGGGRREADRSRTARSSASPATATS